MEIMIDIKNLWKKFGTLPVLQGLDLQVRSGETLVILGRSGVGKSVLLKHIMGLTKPDQGEIIVGGQSITALKGAALYKALRHMGMLFQGAALFDSMNIEENTEFSLVQHGVFIKGRSEAKGHRSFRERGTSWHREKNALRALRRDAQASGYGPFKAVSPPGDFI